MRRTIVVAAVAAALIGGAQLAPAPALGTPACCGCVPGGAAQTSGFFNGTANGATFCAQAPPANITALEENCNSLPGHGLKCIPHLGNQSCITELAAAGVDCPSAGAPTAGSSTLLTLAIVLAAGGILVLRRRGA